MQFFCFSSFSFDCRLCMNVPNVPPLALSPAHWLLFEIPKSCWAHHITSAWQRINKNYRLCSFFVSLFMPWQAIGTTTPKQSKWLAHIKIDEVTIKSQNRREKRRQNTVRNAFECHKLKTVTALIATTAMEISALLCAYQKKRLQLFIIAHYIASLLLLLLSRLFEKRERNDGKKRTRTHTTELIQIYTNLWIPFYFHGFELCFCTIFKMVCALYFQNSILRECGFCECGRKRPLSIKKFAHFSIELASATMKVRNDVRRSFTARACDCLW